MLFGVILAVPLACVPAVAQVAADPTQSRREVGGMFATLAIDQGIEEDPPLPLVGARLTWVFQRRFGLEAGISASLVTVRELSAVAVVKLRGVPVLLRAGVSHVPGTDYGDHGSVDAETGFHLGASLLSGDADDRARFRIDYTYRQFGRQERGTSSVGVGLVLSLGSD